jgi:hypothetical protein
LLGLFFDPEDGGHIFLDVVGLYGGPHNLVRIFDELLYLKNSGSGLEN